MARFEVDEFAEYELRKWAGQETTRAIRAIARKAGVELHKTGWDRYRRSTEMERKVIAHVVQLMRDELDECVAWNEREEREAQEEDDRLHPDDEDRERAEEERRVLETWPGLPPAEEGDA